MEKHTKLVVIELDIETQRLLTQWAAEDELTLSEEIVKILKEKTDGK
jgi:macrodomain Ter protein organizer (MatP/YcbG family)